MRQKRLIRWITAVAGALIATGSGSSWREQSTRGKERIVTLTVWVNGTGQAQCDAMTNDSRDGPGNTIRKYAFSDNATAYCLGKTSYRVKKIQEDADGGNVQLEKIDSTCPSLGISGGGEKRASYHYRAKYGDGTEWTRDQASWTYVMGQLEEAWGGPELDFGSSRDFEIRPPGLPVISPSSEAIGKGVDESSRRPRHEYTSDFPLDGRGAVEKAYGKALYDDKEFKDDLRGRLDWSKPIFVTGHASYSQTTRHPVTLVQVEREKISGGDKTSQASIDLVWTISDEPETAEMDLIPPTGYERWLPRGGRDEKTPGSGFTIKIDIHKMGEPGVAPVAKVTKLTVWLADTSKETGVCMNVPKVEKATGDYDYRIKSTPGWTVKKEGQWADADKPEPKSALVLNCYDYGGWTQVMATAELADGRHLVGRIKGGSQSTQLAVPMDDNRNHIGDGWERAGTATGATEDTDSLPRGNDVEGDGLSQYEEYRGFKCKTVHTRTDPNHKDLFIHDPGHLDIGLFGESGITVHFVNKGEFDQEAGFTNENVINVNRDFATLGPQHLLHLSNMRLKGASGRAVGTGPGTPKETRIVAVDVAKCSALGEGGLAATIAHELGHGCNLWHHGEIDYQAYDLQEFQPGSGLWKPTEYAGQEDKIKLMVAAKGGQESGVEECIMRYNSAFVYETESGDWRWHRSYDREEWIVGKLCPGPGPQTIFCTQKKGTGVNDPEKYGGSMAGDAKKGECLYQIQVNDLKPVK